MKILTKLTLVGVFFLTYLLPSNSFSQNIQSTSNTTDRHTFVKKDLKIDRFYTQKDLEKLPKLDLIAIYKDRLAYLIEILPFLSLHPKPGATFHDMAIPETESNISHLDKETSNKQEFVGSLFETLDDVVPYSEKDNIIWCILFFEEMIQKSDYVK